MVALQKFMGSINTTLIDEGKTDETRTVVHKAARTKKCDGNKFDGMIFSGIILALANLIKFQN